ncbi:MAG: recombinase family protein [Candidatus Nealsonbacteria bacterium]
MEKALIYCRVSTEDQANKGYSLDAQEKFCKRFADDKGYAVEGVFRDEGKSGTNLDRPALQDMLAKCQQKEEAISAVLVQETDRLARSTKDHLTIKAILKKAGIKLISVAQPMLDDSPEGNMIDTILASVNQFQSDINSRKTKKGLQERFDSGWWPGWSPLGYMKKDLENGKSIVAPDPEKWHLIREGLKMYLTGNYSATEISDILYEKGLTSRTSKRICNSIMVSTLKNPFYTGLLRWNGQEKMGNHKPMITLEEHQQILTIMDSHNQHACRRRIHNFLLRGFVFCDICGQRYTAEKHRQRKNSDYYHCSAVVRKHSNQGQNIEVGELEKQVEEQFRGIKFTQEFIDLTIRKVKDFYQKRTAEINNNKQGLLNKKMAAEKKREVAENKLIAGSLKDDGFMRIRDRLEVDIKNIQKQIDEREKKRKVDINTIRDVLLLTRNIYEAYKKAPPEVKRLYLSLFWDGFWARDKQIVRTKLTKLIENLVEEKDVIIRNNWLLG